MPVTDEERATHAAISKKMQEDQIEATQEFALLMVQKETEELFVKIAELRDKCVTGSNAHTMFSNILSVVTTVKGQFPPRQTPIQEPEAP